MKCASCGGNLSLEDVVCPYCDALNEHAVEHIRQMNQYKREFEGTKKEVYSVTKGYAGITVRAVICAILVLCIAVLIVIKSHSYDVRWELEEWNARKHADEYCLQMDRYLEERDYIGLSTFCIEKNINVYDEEYSKYKGIVNVAAQYTQIYMNIMRMRESELLGTDSIRYLADSLDYFYDTWNPESYMYVGEDAEQQQILSEIREQAHALLRTYCGLTAEDMDEFPDLSSGKRAALIEERMNDAE